MGLLVRKIEISANPKINKSGNIQGKAVITLRATGTSLEDIRFQVDNALNLERINKIYQYIKGTARLPKDIKLDNINFSSDNMDYDLEERLKARKNQ